MMLRRDGSFLISFCQLVKVFFDDLFFRICHLQELCVKHIDVIAIEGVADFMKAESQGTASAAGGEYDPGFFGSYFPGIDDLIGGGIFQESVLVDTG